MCWCSVHIHNKSVYTHATQCVVLTGLSISTALQETVDLFIFDRCVCFKLHTGVDRASKYNSLEEFELSCLDVR